MFELTRRLEFSAAHRLHAAALSVEENRSLYGVCNHLHGHNYVLEVTVHGEADATTGMVMDLNRLAALLHEVVFTALDHRRLEEDVPWLHGQVSTAENVARGIWEQLWPHLGPLLRRVRLYESAANFVDYSGPSKATRR